MKRDMDLIRKILIKMEEAPDPNEIPPITLEGYSESQVHFHLKLLYEAGLIHAIDSGSGGEMEIIPVSIRWEGYDFLENIRDEGRWHKVKETIVKKGGTMAFEVVKAVAVDLAKRAVLP